MYAYVRVRTDLLDVGTGLINARTHLSNLRTHLSSLRTDLINMGGTDLMVWAAPERHISKLDHLQQHPNP